jgi:hypothetical protein
MKLEEKKVVNEKGLLGFAAPETCRTEFTGFCSLV